MPVYDYKCNKCGKVFEYQQRISEDALTKCPEEICDQEVKCTGNVERIISKNIGLVFKGSGFYLTDYANKKTSTGNGSKEKTTENLPSPEKTETKTDTKTGTTAEAKAG